jgi:hypothetical protein
MLCARIDGRHVLGSIDGRPLRMWFFGMSHIVFPGCCESTKSFSLKTMSWKSGKSFATWQQGVQSADVCLPCYPISSGMGENVLLVFWAPCHTKGMHPLAAQKACHVRSIICVRRQEWNPLTLLWKTERKMTLFLRRNDGFVWSATFRGGERKGDTMGWDHHNWLGMVRSLMSCQWTKSFAQNVLEEHITWPRRCPSS